MTSRDALNLYLESDHTSAILIHAVVVDVESGAGEGIRHHDDAVRYARSVVHLDPIFTQRLHRYPLNVHYPYWIEDPADDVASHVSVTRQEPGDIDIVRRRTIELSREFFDLGAEPAWQLHFLVDLHGVDGVPDGGTVMIVKFHHSAIDGVGASDLISRMLSPRPPVARDAADLVRVPSAARAIAAIPADVLRFAARGVGYAVATRRARADERRQPAPSTVPATRFNGDKPPSMEWDLAWFDLDEIRRVKSTYDGVTVNDLLTAMISLTVSTYLGERGELPETSLSISMPMSTRSIRDGDTANQLAPMLVDLHTDIADPPDRLRAIHASLREAKDAVARRARGPIPPNPMTTLPSVIVPLVGALTPAPPAHPATAPVTTMLSNVSYGSGRLELLGAPVVGCFGVLPTVRGVHLAHSVRSVGRSLSVSVTATRSAMSDLNHYLDVLRSSLDRLDTTVD